MPPQNQIVSFTLICAAGVALILGSAASPNQAVTTATRISDAEFDSYSGAGKCSIVGQAFLKTRGGDVKYGAGETVLLMPNIPLLNQVIRINSTPGQYVSLPQEVDQKWQQLRRQTQADGEGKFEFNGIPCGKWYVESRVNWEVARRSYSSVEGGLVSTWATVTPDSSPAKVILTR